MIFRCYKSSGRTVSYNQFAPALHSIVIVILESSVVTYRVVFLPPHMTYHWCCVTFSRMANQKAAFGLTAREWGTMIKCGKTLVLLSWTKLSSRKRLFSRREADSEESGKNCLKLQQVYGKSHFDMRPPRGLICKSFLATSVNTLPCLCTFRIEIYFVLIESDCRMWRWSLTYRPWCQP